MQSDNILVSPYTAIRLFNSTYKTIGSALLSERDYKVTREAWIGSIFLLGLSSYSGDEWFFKPEKNSGSPDFYCYKFSTSSNRAIINRSEIKLEVFEWRKEENESNFIDALKKIKLSKIIDPYITIVCYIRRNEVLPPVIELNKLLKKLHPKVKDIWYIGDITSDSKVWRIAQVYPNILAIDLDYDKALSIKEQHSFIQPYRGVSKGIRYEPTGKKVILTPQFDIKVE